MGTGGRSPALIPPFPSSSAVISCPPPFNNPPAFLLPRWHKPRSCLGAPRCFIPPALGPVGAQGAPGGEGSAPGTPSLALGGTHPPRGSQWVLGKHSPCIPAHPWYLRALPEQGMLPSVPLAPGSSSLTPLPREWWAVPGGEHPSLRAPASSSCAGCKRHLCLSLPTTPVTLGSKASAWCLGGCSEGTSLAGDGRELSLARRRGWRVALRAPPRASPSPPAPPGSPLRLLAVGCPKQIDFIFPFVNKGGESTVS